MNFETLENVQDIHFLDQSDVSILKTWWGMSFFQCFFSFKGNYFGEFLWVTAYVIDLKTDQRYSYFWPTVLKKLVYKTFN